MRPIFSLILLIVIVLNASALMENDLNRNIRNDLKTNAIDKNADLTANERNTWNLIEKLKEQINEKESELENAEKINKGFERMIQLINIMGQVDTFLTDRTRLVLKKLALLADDLDNGKKF